MIEPWEALSQAAVADPPLRRLFELEPGRVRTLTFEACGLHLDLSKQPWSEASFARALDLIAAADLPA
ncbi:MAG: glucose-6-phosphate isomerase, partial [Phenylobacterium sp.]|nr:glucose-6-phosphate isomerase [Phenylobacterium sp.]MCA6272833.1 glucose-6-phosphate isomerase [Phenylobacterium sp.]